MPKCIICEKVQAKLNNGSLCRNCFLNEDKENFILIDNYNLVNEADNDMNSTNSIFDKNDTLDTSLEDRNMIGYVKGIHG